MNRDAFAVLIKSETAFTGLSETTMFPSRNECPEMPFCRQT